MAGILGLEWWRKVEYKCYITAAWFGCTVACKWADLDWLDGTGCPLKLPSWANSTPLPPTLYQMDCMGNRAIRASLLAFGFCLFPVYCLYAILLVSVNALVSWTYTHTLTWQSRGIMWHIGSTLPFLIFPLIHLFFLQNTTYTVFFKYNCNRSLHTAFALLFIFWIWGLKSFVTIVSKVGLSRVV